MLFEIYFLTSKVVQETTSTLTNFIILSLAIFIRQIFAVGFNIFVFLPFGKIYGFFEILI
jgi:hypothetical protein